MITRILCASDGSDHAKVALGTAADLARRYGAELALCVVNVEFGDRPTGPQALIWTADEAAKILADAKAVLEAAGGTVTRADVLLAHDASAGICRHAREIGADHIVIGTGDKRGLERFLLGSVARDVVQRATCSVTIAREAGAH